MTLQRGRIGLVLFKRRVNDPGVRPDGKRQSRERAETDSRSDSE